MFPQMTKFGLHAPFSMWCVDPIIEFSVPTPAFQGDHRQSNGHDCGLWILCMMGAILRGYAITGVRESDMGRVRHVFMEHLYTLTRT